jgi:uncharacterized membrane protein YfcA
MTKNPETDSNFSKARQSLAIFIVVALTATAVYDQITTGQVDRYLASILITAAGAFIGVRLDLWHR